MTTTRPLWWGLAISALVIAGVAGCPPLDGKRATGGACRTAGDCQGALCLSLKPNDQGKSGLCSQSCSAQTCGASGVCLDVGGGTSACFETCATQGGCQDGFVCISLQDGTGRGVCFVTATGGGGAGGTGGSGGSGGTGGGGGIGGIGGIGGGGGGGVGGGGGIDGGGGIISGTVSDIDGNVYATVVIGAQTWMAANLATTRFRDGTAIADVSDGTAWRLTTGPARCDYDNSAGNASTYGRLYNHYAAMTGTLCPTGWHVATDAEWATLEAFLGSSDPGGKLKEAGTAHWMSPNSGADNSTGFAGLPGGQRYCTGTFNDITYSGYWWTATPGTTAGNGRYRRLDFTSTFILSSEYDQREGHSVRCVKD